MKDYPIGGHKRVPRRWTGRDRHRFAPAQPSDGSAAARFGSSIALDAASSRCRTDHFDRAAQLVRSRQVSGRRSSGSSCPESDSEVVSVCGSGLLLLWLGTRACLGYQSVESLDAQAQDQAMVGDHLCEKCVLVGDAAVEGGVDFEQFGSGLVAGGGGHV
jgi:hypothetical protein